MSIVQIGHNVYGNGGFGKNVKVEVVAPNTGKQDLDLNWFECVRMLRKKKADVCVLTKGDLHVASWRLDFTAKLLFPRYITIEHGECPRMPAKTSARHFGGLVPGLGLWWWSILLPRYIRSCAPHRIVCVSSMVRDQLIGSCRFPPRKVMAVPNGIDTNRFRRVRKHGQEIRLRWGIPADALVFGAIGRLSPEKGYDTALELFGRLVASMPERAIHLVIVGDGPLKDTLRSAIEEGGLEGRVTLTGFYDRPWEAYSVIDIFLMPSQREGLPLSMLEAMACGCRPIAMGVGGIPEVIVDKRFGWLINPSDKEGFFEAMREAALTDRGALEEMGRAARARIVSHFNANDQFRKLAEIIEARA